MRKNICLHLFLLIVFNNNISALQRESDHFKYFYEEPDSSIIDSIILRLEGSYDRITSDLQITLGAKINVHIYPTLQQFHNAIGWSNASDWIVGVGGTEIHVVSPLNPGPAHSYNTIMNNVFIHEFTHVCMGKISGSFPIWLSEGFACHEGGPYYSQSSVVSAYNSLGRIPTLDELSYNFNTFSQIGGYPFSLTIAYFAINNFGMDAMRSFIYDPEDFSVFAGLTKDQFQEQWFDYVNINYLGTSSTDFSGISAPSGFMLMANYPNPFNPSTTISYFLPVESKVVVEIFNATGEKISTLNNATEAAGSHKIIWNTGNDRSVPSGIYFCRLRALPAEKQADGNKLFEKVNKLVLMR